MKGARGNHKPQCSDMLHNVPQRSTKLCECTAMGLVFSKHTRHLPVPRTKTTRTKSWTTLPSHYGGSHGRALASTKYGLSARWLLGSRATSIVTLGLVPCKNSRPWTSRVGTEN